MTEVWTNWAGQVVNGLFPLRRFLSATDHSSVFLTESGTEGFLNAAIKIVPADPAASEVQLWQWKTAATFSHPHLIRLLDSGRWELDGREWLYVVMEYAEETLSQTLPYRALVPEEVRELLVPTLEALAFLHRENWAQGQLKPSNFLVVNDQLKLAIDTLRPVAVARGRVANPTLYDPPETERGEVSAAGDIWALGVTLTEALTQYPPTWPNGRSEPPALPASLPGEFLDTVQRCLRPDPADRPTVDELQGRDKPNTVVRGAPSPKPAPPLQTVSPSQVAQPLQAAPSLQPTPPLQPTSPAPVVAPSPIPQPPAPPATQSPPPASAAPASPLPAASLPNVRPQTPMRALPPAHFDLDEQQKRGPWALAAMVLLAIVVIVWGGSRLLRSHPSPQKSAATPALSPAETSAPEGSSPATQPLVATAPSPESPPPKAAATPDRPTAPRQVASARNPVASGTTSANGVVHEEIPKVSPGARSTIRGHVRVGVRVIVDKSGRVVRDTLDNPGPSRYFNRVASEAARKWTFAESGGDRSREWLLRFEFGREGTTVHAVRLRS